MQAAKVMKVSRLPLPDGYLIARDNNGRHQVLVHKLHNDDAPNDWRLLHTASTRYLAVSWAWRDYGRRVAQESLDTREN